MSRIRRWLSDITAAAPCCPLVVLFGLNAVDELDRTAFAVLLPEIRDEFGLDLAGRPRPSSPSSPSPPSLLQVPIAVAVPTVTAGSRIAVDRRARVGAVLVAHRPGDDPAHARHRPGRLGIGKAVVDPTHNSLLADYYDIPYRPRVYSFHRAANAVGACIGPLVGRPARRRVRLAGRRSSSSRPDAHLRRPRLEAPGAASRGGYERRAMGVDGSRRSTPRSRRRRSPRGGGSSGRSRRCGASGGRCRSSPPSLIGFVSLAVVALRGGLRPRRAGPRASSPPRSSRPSSSG